MTTRCRASPKNPKESRLRKVLIAGVVVIVAGVAGFFAWQHYQTSANAVTQTGQAPAELSPIDSPLPARSSCPRIAFAADPHPHLSSGALEWRRLQNSAMLVRQPV